MGRVWKFDDNIDTDVITPSEYLGGGPEEYSPHALEPVRPEFAADVEPGDVVVAGKNFGAGSSRETAPRALLYNEVGAVVARSFARIFFRNAINVGLPVYVSKETARRSEDGDELEIHQDAIVNATRGETYPIETHPPFIRDIVDAGGLVGYHEELQRQS